MKRPEDMTINELEAILWSHADSPEMLDDADTWAGLEPILAEYSRRRREQDPARKTAEEAYQEFLKHYLPEAKAQKQYLDLAQLYDGIDRIRNELEENHHEAEIGCVDYKTIKALAAAYELLDYLSGRIATSVSAGDMEAHIDY